MSQDREFETYLQGKTDLSQLYADLPQVELPDHLDATILAEAHRAVNSRPAARPKRRWSIPLSMVASLIVAVMIGLQLPYLLEEASLQQQPQEERRIAVATTDKRIAEPSSGAPEETRKMQPMAKPKSEFARGAPAPLAVETEAARANAPVLAAPEESTAAESEPSGLASGVASPPAAAPAQAPAIAAKRPQLRESADVDNGMALAREKKASAHAAGDFSADFEQRAPAAAAMPAPQPAQAQPNRSLMQPSKEEASEASLRPEDWLVRIQRLKQQGKLDEARKDLAEFKKRYPDYRVPEALEVR